MENTSDDVVWSAIHIFIHFDFCSLYIDMPVAPLTIEICKRSDVANAEYAPESLKDRQVWYLVNFMFWCYVRWLICFIHLMESLSRSFSHMKHLIKVSRLFQWNDIWQAALPGCQKTTKDFRETSRKMRHSFPALLEYLKEDAGRRKETQSVEIVNLVYSS